MQSFDLGMPPKYREHYLCNQVIGIFNFFFAQWDVEAYLTPELQLKSLMNEEVLNDVTVRFG